MNTDQVDHKIKHSVTENRVHIYFSSIYLSFGSLPKLSIPTNTSPIPSSVHLAEYTEWTTTTLTLPRNSLPKVAANTSVFVNASNVFGLKMIQAIGGGSLAYGLANVHLLCNDGRWLAIQHFAENEQNSDGLTLDGSRYIYIFTYPHIWGIVGHIIERTFVVLTSELTGNCYLLI